MFSICHKKEDLNKFMAARARGKDSHILMDEESEIIC